MNEPLGEWREWRPVIFEFVLDRDGNVVSISSEGEALLGLGKGDNLAERLASMGYKGPIEDGAKFSVGNMDFALHRLKGRGRNSRFVCFAYIPPEKYIESISEGMNYGLVRLDGEGTIRFANTAFIDMLGMPRNLVLYSSIYDWIADDENGELLKSVMELAVDGEQRIELEMRSPKRNRIFASVSVFRNGDEYTLLVDDITASREYLESFMETESFKSAIISAIRDALLVIDRDGKITYLSPHATDVMGMPYEVVLNSYLADHIGVDRAERVISEASGTDEFVVEWQGLKRHIHISWNEMRGPEGEKEAVLIVLKDTTHLHEIEEKLRNLKEYWERSFNAVPDPVFILDPDHTIKYANTAARAILGGDIAGKKCYEVVHGTGHPPPGCPYVMGRRSSGLATGQYDGIMTGKGHRSYHVTVSPIFDRDGSMVEAIHVMHDITPLVEMERKAEEARKKAETYLELVDVMVVALDSEGRITLANRKAREILECGDEDIIGLDWFDNFLPQDIRRDVRSVFRKIMAGEVKTVERYDNPVLTRKGRIRTILWHNAVLTTESGNIIGTLSAGLDVTEERKLRKELVESEERYRTIVESVRFPIFIHSKGRILFANHAAMEMTGYSEAEIRLHRIWDFVHPEDKKWVMDRYKRRIADEDVPPTYELRIVRKGGDVAHVEITVVPIKLMGENAYMISVYDLTEIKKLNMEVEDREKRYRSIFNSSQDAIFLMEGEKFIDCNSAAEEIFGFSRDKLIGSHPWAISPEKQPDGTPSIELARKYVNSALSGQPQRFNWVHRRSDGSEFHSVVSLNAFESGDKKYIMAMVHDISALVDAKNEVEEREALLNAVVEHSTNGIFLVDPRGRVVVWNAAMERISGLARGAVLGSSAEDTVCQLFECENKHDLKRGMGGGQFRGEVEALSVAGDTTPVILEATSFDTPRGTYRLIVATDISEIRKATRRLEHRLKMETALSRVMADLFASDDLDTGIESALRSVGIALGVQAVFLFEAGEGGEVEIPGQWMMSAPAMDLEDIIREAMPHLPEIKECLDSNGHCIIDRSHIQKVYSIIRNAGYGSVLLLPLKGRNGITVGAMALASSRDREWEPWDIDILSVASSTLGIYIQSSRFANALRRSEEMFRSTLESLDIYIFRVDQSGNIILNNRRAVDMFGDHRGEEIVGTVIPEEMSPKADSLLAGNEEEIICRGLDGSYRYVVFRAVSLIGGDIVVAGVDITETMEERTRAEGYAVMFETLAASAPVGIFILDDSGRTTYANPSFMETFAVANPVGMHIGDMLSAPISHEKWKGLLAKVLESRHKVHSMILSARKPGGEFTAEFRLVSTNLESDTIIIGTVEDISQRMEYISQIKAERERFSHLYYNAPVGYLTVGDDGIINMANEMSQRILGFDPVGKKVSAILGKKWRAALKKSLERAVVINHSRDGMDLDILMTTSMLETAGIPYLCTLQDITEVVKLRKLAALEEMRYAALMSSQTTIIIFINSDGSVDMNATAERYFGHTEAEELKRVFDLRHKRPKIRKYEGSVFLYNVLPYGWKGKRNYLIMASDITGEIQAREALLEKKKQLENFLTGSPTGYILYEKDTGKIIYINRAARKIFGLKGKVDDIGGLSSAVGSLWRFEDGSPVDLSPPKRGMKTWQLPMYDSTGRRRVLDIRVTRFSHGGKGFRAIVVGDITEREGALEEIKKRNIYLSSLNRIAVKGLSPDELREVSREALDTVSGVKNIIVLSGRKGKPPRIAISVGESSETVETILSGATDIKDASRELRALLSKYTMFTFLEKSPLGIYVNVVVFMEKRHMDQTTRWFFESAAVAILGKMEVMYHIEDIEKGRETLQEHTRLLEGMWDILERPVAFADGKMRVVYCNDDFAGLVGMDVDDIKGKSIERLIKPHFKLDMETVLSLISEGMGRGRFRHKMATKDGARYMVWEIIPLTGIDRKTKGVLFLGEDISTERRRGVQDTLTSVLLEGSFMRPEDQQRYISTVLEIIEEKYMPGVHGSGVESFALAVTQILVELGGWFDANVGEDTVEFVSTQCPWGDAAKRNTIYCNICNGILQRFTNRYLGKYWDSSIKETMGRGDRRCYFVSRRLKGR